MPNTEIVPDSVRTAPRRRGSAAGTWWRRRPVNRAFVLLHRWAALILGLFLVVECTSGAILLYRGELFRATNGNLYQHTASNHPIAPQEAIEIVDKAHPDFSASWVAPDDGVYAVGEPSYVNQYFVDPGTGHINGRGSMDTGLPALLGNIHDCAFTCENEPGYNSWLATPIWQSGPTFMKDITRGGLILGVLGLLLILLALTSLKIWWPGLRRIKQRFVVRRGRGRFARDHDLHNVIGAIGLPFLLMWGITGATFEFPVVEKAWLTITGGEQEPTPTYAVTPNPAAKKNPQISLATATDVALAKAPGTVSFIGLPSPAAPYYEIDITTGYASSAYRAIYHADAYVYIDAHDAGNAAVVDNGTGPTANRFYDKFLEPTHFGWNVNGWWRIVWEILGLTPLALMITGLSTWLFRRGVKKRRKQAGRERLTDAQLDPDRLDREGGTELDALDPSREVEGGRQPDDEPVPAR